MLETIVGALVKAMKVVTGFALSRALPKFFDHATSGSCCYTEYRSRYLHSVQVTEFGHSLPLLLQITIGNDDGSR